jgi:hypothetical protein
LRLTNSRNRVFLGKRRPEPAYDRRRHQQTPIDSEPCPGRCGENRFEDSAAALKPRQQIRSKVACTLFVKRWAFLCDG